MHPPCPLPIDISWFTYLQLWSFIAIDGNVYNSLVHFSKFVVAELNPLIEQP